MSKIFPPMNSKPEKGQIIGLIPGWAWVFVLIPMFMPFLGLGLWDMIGYSVWLEIGYHAVNGIVMLCIMLSYLKEEWFMVSTAFSYYLKHISLTVVLAAGAELLMLGILYLIGFNMGVMLDCLPIVEMSVVQSPLLVLDIQPIWGTIALSVFSPISICALFYCFAFAPACGKETWLGYLCIGIVTMIPAIINIIWRGETETAFVLTSYLVQLPIHLVMCWSYQKTDNVWTPLVSLAIVNMLTCIFMIAIVL